MKMTQTVKFVLVAFVIAAFLASSCCRPSAKAPSKYDEFDELPSVYPDYVETTFPPNIAPANFMIEEEAQDYVVRLSGADGTVLCVSGKKAIFPEKQWRKLLDSNKGGKIAVDIFVKKENNWLKYKTFENSVSKDPTDPYLAYRLIEPGYDYGHRIILAQRRVENFDEQFFFDNRSVATSPCINCHSFQDRKTERFLFHYRRTDDPKQGGTIVVNNEQAVKLSGKVDVSGINCTYPSWRPSGDLVAFSANQTRQFFHSISSQKLEVFDAFSDLVVMDVANNELKVVTDSNDEFETFPSWSPDGNTLYYCSARFEPNTPQDPVDGRVEEMAKRARELRYNVYKRRFDESTRSFGEPELVVDAASQGRSALFPRVSPDGKLLVYTQAESGTFPIWRPEADLYLLNLETGDVRAWDEVNGDNSDSYHTWSSTGRWIVFSSRREDGQYTRLYLAYVDENGVASKPFVIPQRDPEHNRKRYKSYNVPEMLVEPIKIDYKELLETAKEDALPTNNL